MSDKIYSDIRVLMKHDITINWAKAVNFVPKAGEIIVYDDYFTDEDSKLPGIKIGDGSHNVNDLPFIDKRMIEHINNEAIHSDTKVAQKAANGTIDEPVLFAKVVDDADEVNFNTQVSINPAAGRLTSKSYGFEQHVITTSETSTGGWVWYAGDGITAPEYHPPVVEEPEIEDEPIVEEEPEETT